METKLYNFSTKNDIFYVGNFLNLLFYNIKLFVYTNLKISSVNYRRKNLISSQ